MEILLEAGIQVLCLLEVAKYFSQYNMQKGKFMILCTFFDKNEPFHAI